jgi:hypothetical protein
VCALPSPRPTPPQREGSARWEAEKQDPHTVMREVRAAIAEERRQGTVTTPLAVMLRDSPSGETEVVVAVVDDAEELEHITAVIDQIITEHGGKAPPACCAEPA